MCAALWGVKGQIVICKGPFHPSMCTRHLASAGLIYGIFLSPESTDNWPSLAVYEANFRHWTMWPQQSAWHIYQVVYSPVGRLLKLWANDAPASGRRFLWGGHKLAHIPENTRSWISVGLALVQRRRRWTNAKPPLIQLLVFAGYVCHRHTEFAHQVGFDGRVWLGKWWESGSKLQIQNISNKAVSLFRLLGFCYGGGLPPEWWKRPSGEDMISSKGWHHVLWLLYYNNFNFKKVCLPLPAKHGYCSIVVFNPFYQSIKSLINIMICECFVWN